MAKFSAVPRYFLKKKMFEFFKNFVCNFHSKVSDVSFFDPIEMVFSEAEVESIVRTSFRTSELKRLDAEGVLNFETQSIGRILSALWSDLSTRKVCQVMLEEMATEVINECVADEKREKDAIIARFDNLCESIKLNELEREILLFAYLLRESTFTLPEKIDRVDFPYYVAMGLDRSYAEVKAVMNPEGRLLTFGLLDEDWDFNSRYLGYFNGAGSEGEILKERLYRAVDLTETLPLAYYGEELEEKAKLLLKLIEAGGKLNILFYGTPGTGKTCLAKTLAKLSGRRTFEIMQGGKDEGRLCLRTGAIALCNEREKASDGLLLIDEADELLRDGKVVDRLKSTEKGTTNTLLDAMKLPAIWISNTPSYTIDGSVRRRFDYSIEFSCLNGEQRIRIWKNSIEKHALGDLISDDKIKEYAKQYMTNAGGISFALQNLKRLNPKPEDVDKCLNTLLGAHCQLMNITPPEKPEAILPVADYSLDGINVKGKVPLAHLIDAVRNFSDSDYAAKDLDQPRMNILLSGTPGSGKTEFVKYLGKVLNRRVLFKRVSDILSPYVGESERHINEAFRQAEQENAILFFDEVDSLVRDRRGAFHSWEVTQVNEFLQQMESFKGILIAATNLRKTLDAATIRRFTFKLEFDYLTNEGKRFFFERIFKTKLTDEEFTELAQLETLVPGDFRTVRQAFYYLGRKVNNADLITALREECEVKPKEMGDATPIGFFQTKESRDHHVGF